MSVPENISANHLLKISGLSKMDIDEDSKAMSSDDEASNQLPSKPQKSSVPTGPTLARTMKKILSKLDSKMNDLEFLETVEPFNSIKKQSKQKKKRKKSVKTTIGKKPRALKINQRQKTESIKAFQPSSANLSLAKKKKKGKRSWKSQQKSQFDLKKLDRVQRANYDVYFSSKDTVLQEMGKHGGSYIKQNVKHYTYTSPEHAQKDQGQEWKWEIWLDPSAPAHVIHPQHTLQGKKPSKLLLNADPIKINLQKEFGNGIEFIYISPQWKSTNFGYGNDGWFTTKHLRELNLEGIQRRGFVFIWVKWDDIQEIINIFKDEKGYTYSDSTAAVCSTWQDGISVRKRNPSAQKEDVIGRMCGTKIQGVLFKKKTKSSEGRFRIGNQIICDIFFMRQKRDPRTGQQYMDHGYVYQMYQYLIVEKNKGTQALHLYAPPKLNQDHWGGVSYYPLLK